MSYLNNLRLNLRFNEPLKNYTTFRIGGSAGVFAKPKNTKELKSLLKMLIKEKKRFFILGRGSNILVDDEGFKGTVISLGEGEFLRVEGTPEKLVVGAGTKISKLLAWCEKNGFSGLEFMAGIPASIGGAIRQNAGLRKRTIAEAIKDITYLDEEGELETLQGRDLRFSYRRLELKLTAIIAATLKLTKSTPGEVTERIRYFFNLKRKKQPLEEKSAGCIFKNPDTKSAGLLIEEVGLKGKRRGGAFVSEKHANFIINKKDATCRDVLELIDLIKREVKLKKNILLEEEINILK
jgi:UDP-N-acetylmuramate dehydrogenase